MELATSILQGKRDEKTDGVLTFEAGTSFTKLVEVSDSTAENKVRLGLRGNFTTHIQALFILYSSLTVVRYIHEQKCKS